MNTSNTLGSVELVVALVQRATFLADDGDPFAADPNTYLRLASLALASFAVTAEPIAPDLQHPEVLAQGTVLDCLRAAMNHAQDWDLGELNHRAVSFVTELHDLARAHGATRHRTSWSGCAGPDIRQCRWGS